MEYASSKTISIDILTYGMTWHIKRPSQRGKQAKQQDMFFQDLPGQQGAQLEDRNHQLSLTWCMLKQIRIQAMSKDTPKPN